MQRIGAFIHTGGPGNVAGDGTPTKAGMGEGEVLLREGDAWRPAATICGITMGYCMLLLLGVIVLVATTLAVVLPQEKVTVQEISVSIWQQGPGISERAFDLEVSLCSVLPLPLWQL